jgi:hypothetical protein
MAGIQGLTEDLPRNMLNFRKGLSGMGRMGRVKNVERLAKYLGLKRARLDFAGFMVRKGKNGLLFVSDGVNNQGQGNNL